MHFSLASTSSVTVMIRHNFSRFVFSEVRLSSTPLCYQIRLELGKLILKCECDSQINKADFTTFQECTLMRQEFAKWN